MTDFLRRLFEIIFSIVVLVLFSPFWLLIALGIRLTSPGEIIYKSRRFGKGCRPFNLYKFRSMVTNADHLGSMNVGDTDSRVTKIGRFLRITRLDEFPQFVNVLLGQIGLVGPRPDIEYYVRLYTEEQKKIIFAIKPGITDWASLSNFEQYRDFARADDPDRFFEAVIRPLKVDLQLYYCTHRSLTSDLYIILCTALRIIKVKLPLPKGVREIIAKHRAIIAGEGVSQEETSLSQPNGTGR